MKINLGKRAAIEMSIGTIVVIVIALTMLILGIVLVKSIMCSGIQLSEELSVGVKNQVRDLFGADTYGVRCVGEGGNEVKLATGGRRQIVCIIKTEEVSQYDIKVKSVESLKGASTNTVEGWVLDQDWLKGSVSPGGEGTEAVVMLLDIPKDAPTTSLKLKIEAKNLESDSISTHTSYIDIVPLGFFKTTLC